MALPEAVVLFGPSGFVGRNIVEALRGRVGLLMGVNHSGAPVEGCDETLAAAQIDTMRTLPGDCIIINVAAFRYVATTFAHDQPAILSANVALTDQVYRFAVTRGVTEIRNASSVAVYPAAWPVLDDNVPVDLNAWPHAGEASYAWSKRWGEIMANIYHQASGISTISFRITNPYGPFDGLDEAQTHVATAFVLRAVKDGPDFEIRGDPQAERDFVFSGDIAKAFEASLHLRAIHDAVNLAAGFTTTIAHLAQTAMQAAHNVRPLRLTNPSSAGVKIRRATARRLRELLPDLAPFCSIEAGMARTLDWYRHALS
jgi:nucleoside-diphosphate-sugar epimerase